MNLTKSINFTRLIYTTFGIVFLISGLLINFMQLILYIFVRPFSKILFRQWNYYLNYSINSRKHYSSIPPLAASIELVFLQQYWANVRVILHSSKYDFDHHLGREHAFLLMNHSYEIDWIIGWILCDACRILGNAKTWAKKSIQYVPILGFSWKIGGNIFVERNWQRDQKGLETNLRELISYKDPIWLLLTAEGTRFTEEKHEASKAFARQHGLPELRHHLTPRTRGFTTSVPIIRDKIAAVYNINLGIEPGGVKPTLTNILLGKSINAEFYIERIPMKDLPENEADLAAWLHSCYKRKDDLIHSFLTTGNWRADGKQYESFPLPRRIFPAVNFACWFVCVSLTLVFFLIRLLMTGSFISLFMVLGIIGSFVYLLEKLIGETQITKASSYGTQKKT